MDQISSLITIAPVAVMIMLAYAPATVGIHTKSPSLGPPGTTWQVGCFATCEHLMRAELNFCAQKSAP